MPKKHRKISNAASIYSKIISIKHSISRHKIVMILLKSISKPISRVKNRWINSLIHFMEDYENINRL